MGFFVVAAVLVFGFGGFCVCVCFVLFSFYTLELSTSFDSSLSPPES